MRARSSKPARGGRWSALARVLAAAVLAAASIPASAAPDAVAAAEPMAAEDVVSPRQILEWAGAAQQQVVVRLRTGSVAEAEREALAAGADRERARHARRAAVESEQADFLVRNLLALPGARLVARVTHVLNAVFLEVDAASLDAIARDPSVARVAPVGRYEVNLAETVPHVGASEVHAAGFTGAGVRVAVLDSGIDYTHAALGGSGDPTQYAANDPGVIEPGSFPTPKVVGGTDFVGSAWPTGPLAPDPDPLDDGPAAGHGTHVGHIIGGVGGVAPDVSLYAVKVCSSVSTSCSGVALIQGMEFAVDPNGDGDTSDHVDIVNMSLGANYGQPFDDDLSLAVDNATALGVLTVASAGNGSNKPFVTGSPAAAATALSVAQTAVPSATQDFMKITAPPAAAGDYRAVFQPWSVPPAGTISGPVQYGVGGNRLGCAAFPAGSLAGKIVLVDRGACNFTLKAKNVGAAGGLVAVIGLVDASEPFAGGDGGDRPITIPAYMITQDDANLIRANLAAGVMAQFSPDQRASAIRTMVGSSSRGPQFQDFRVKPEIGAPGASVSAVAGTGTLEGVFGGTSGAAPMVTGAAALLVEARGRLSPLELKALLMNAAETDIRSWAGGPLAEISRIGNGELRVNRSLAAPAAAWDARSPTASIGFGWIEATERTSRERTVVVRNYGSRTLDYAISTSFRHANDAATGAVSIQAPARIRVSAGRTRSFEVRLSIDPARLGGNTLNSGSGGANGRLLTAIEYDGYVTLDDGRNPIHLAWHAIPRKAAEVEAEPKALRFGADGTATTRLENEGAGTGQIDVYSLLGLSPNLPQGARGAQAPTPDLRAVGVQTFPVPAGFCGRNPGYVLALAANLWERETHANAPATIEWDIDVTGDGVADWAIFSFDQSLSGQLSDGRNRTWVQNLATNAASSFFFTEHATNTANYVLYACDVQLGSPPLGTPFAATVFAVDTYFGGPFDVLENVSFAPGGERYLAAGADHDLAPGAERDLEVTDAGAAGNDPSEIGLLLFTNGDRGAASRGGATRKTEALVIPAADLAAMRALTASRR